MRINRAVFFVLLFAATFGVLGAFIWGTSIGSGLPLYQNDERSEFYTLGSENHTGGLNRNINLHTADDCFFQGSTGAGGNLDRVDAEAWSIRGSHCTVKVMANTGSGFVSLKEDTEARGLYFADGIIDTAAFRFCNTDGATITDDDCDVYLLTRGGGELRLIDGEAA